MEGAKRIRSVVAPAGWDPLMLSEQVKVMEARPLGVALPPFEHHSELAPRRRTIRLEGLSSFWARNRPFELARQWEQAVSAMAAEPDETWFIISHDASRGFAYTILEADAGDDRLRTAAALNAALPGVAVRELAEVRERADALGLLEGLQPIACSYGVPSSRLDTGRADTGFVSRIARAAGPGRWALAICAIPWDVDDDIDAVLAQIADRVVTVSPWIERSKPGAAGATVKERDPVAERFVALHEAEFERLSEGRRSGLWDVRVHFLAEDAALRSAFTSAIAGHTPRTTTAFPIAVMPIVTAERNAGAVDPVTLMTSLELSSLTRPPFDELPGFPVTEWATFDSAFENRPSGPAITLGHVVDHDSSAAGLPLSDMTRHACIAGITGSGKSTAIWSILGQLDSLVEPVPFLVIEPAKREYRSLPLRAPVRVYTIGDERVAPLRLNPFEVPAGILVQTHLDYLNALFRASFALYPPMPYVLERCLYEIYVDRGWDLSSRGDEIDLPFPTLADLSDKVEEVSGRLGYGAEVTMNVRAALVTRIGTLRLGAKGAMLDTAIRFDAEDFLSAPTVVELERIGNDEEKAFFMGLLLTRVLEHRQAQGTAPEGVVRHVTVVEEAHRLLRNRPQSSDPESASPAAHAVEQFANILAEVRSLGEGIIIADQIPSKLAPDVIKNTNLKMVFRLPAEDDKRSLGSTINLSEEQAKVLTSLSRGESLVFWEGMDHPARLRCGGMELRRRANVVTDEDVHRGSAQSQADARAPWSPRVSQLASVHVNDDHLRRLFLHWLLGPKGGAAPGGMDALDRRLTRALEDRRPADIPYGEFAAAIVTGLFLRAFEGRRPGRTSPDQGADLRLRAASAVQNTGDPAEHVVVRLRDALRPDLEEAWAGAEYPLTGCAHVCATPACIYSAIAGCIVSNQAFREAVDAAMKDDLPGDGVIALRRLARREGAKALTDIEPETPLTVGACALVQALNQRYSEYTIEHTLPKVLGRVAEEPR